MTFEMIITKRKPTTEGIEEHIVRIKNGQAVSTGSELLGILQLALYAPENQQQPIRQQWSEPTIALLKSEPAAPKKEKPAPASAPARPKRVDLIGSNSGGFTIGELLNKEINKQDTDGPNTDEPKKPRVLPHDLVPIDRDPKRRIKLWVNCTECDFEGAKGAALSDKIHKCKQCGTHLRIVDATDEHGALDDKGYACLAQERWLTREELYYKNAQES